MFSSLIHFFDWHAHNVIIIILKLQQNLERSVDFGPESSQHYLPRLPLKSLRPLAWSRLEFQYMCFTKLLKKQKKIHLINCERECLMVYLQNGFKIENNTFFCNIRVYRDSELYLEIFSSKLKFTSTNNLRENFSSIL